MNLLQHAGRAARSTVAGLARGIRHIWRTRIVRPALFGLSFAAAALPAHAAPPRAPLVSETPLPGAFALAGAGQAAMLVYDPADHAVVAHAVRDLAEDVSAVTGIRPDLRARSTAPKSRHIVLIGTIGRSRAIDGLIRQGRIDVRALRGAWESFLILTVPHPLPGIEDALIIVGSDRRGTAYGVYELSEQMGVSPWTWWADVPAQKHEALWIPAGTRRFGPPSVRYRGLFINDEDWGLFPWAARTFDPARGNIGPKTYERVFELLLRLKANTLWPAMHKVSAPFNADSANAKLADDYAIVMGSSHAEPMLRNNVGEWKGTAQDFNYADNPAGVRAYWEQRVRTNARYESLWTLGMRGIHDGGMVGASTLEGRIDLLSSAIADQRAMLRRHVSPDLSGAKQMFMPYKEVLDLYRGGLKIPDDVTIVWPDDNFGYIRQFPSDAERARKGGMGVYYHLSYLGAPLSYIWLGTTPPALVQEEMTRAYDAGARTVWIANAGDIKPAEIGVSLFLEMAWDIDRWRDRDQVGFLTDWAGRTFGPARAEPIAALLDEHFRLNFERRPEHLQSWLPGERPLYPPTTPFEIGNRYKISSVEIDQRLDRFRTLAAGSDAIRASLPQDYADAFFELVDYPVKAAAAANRRFFGAERYDSLVDTQPTIARDAGAAAIAADVELKALTRRFNETIAGGKWRYIITEEPADSQWRQFRTAPVSLPAPGLAGERPSIAPPSPLKDGGVLWQEAEQFVSNDGWVLHKSLGRGAGTMIAQHAGARLAVRMTVPAGGPRTLSLGMLPLFSNDGSDAVLHLDVQIDANPPVRLDVSHPAESPAWTQGVLDNLLAVELPDRLSPGMHDIVIVARSSGVALDRIASSPSAPAAAH
ncbi:glycosyl hydrolase 115 family protein [Sphingomonas sp. BIUV-7]|uniref:Glycosyl hydrolase 115 family protein n=1 Tax=Sphingomonas natans TaxID=3063330 RepID=A0ABT8YAC3_9SPHN|nr:glycosyl hydrolase 115 family protein [Sphingomonas sp. BIUV-7]MDO6414942.1 glycosyl hydrolase 115 family protein [Sphingomonas sp. BIUV-7]